MWCVRRCRRRSVLGDAVVLDLTMCDVGQPGVPDGCVCVLVLALPCRACSSTSACPSCSRSAWSCGPCAWSGGATSASVNVETVRCVCPHHSRRDVQSFDHFMLAQDWRRSHRCCVVACGVQKCKCGGKYPTRQTMWIGYSIQPGHVFAYSKCARAVSFIWIFIFIVILR